MPDPLTFDEAIEVFVRGYCVVKSITHPHEASQLDGVWVMRDTERKNLKDYRKEEYIAFRHDPAAVDALARSHTRGRFFVCAFVASGEVDQSTRDEYKRLGYRLIGTEPFFIHDLNRIPQAESPAVIRRVETAELAERLGKAVRRRPLSAEYFGPDAPLRQYVALVHDEVVGRVRSVHAGKGNWVADLEVFPAHRRQGIATALLERMLRDDRQQGDRSSVLLSSHSGARLYPKVGYREIGVLYLFAPKLKS